MERSQPRPSAAILRFGNSRDHNGFRCETTPERARNGVVGDHTREVLHVYNQPDEQIVSRKILTKRDIADEQLSMKPP
jgi:hypothetical protein